MEQNKQPQCPLFVDFTRECIRDIEVYPHEITPSMLGFCRTQRHINCPFYKMLKTKEPVCKNISKCPAFKNFQIEDFDEFVEISNEYCTSKNHINCQRYITKEKGEVVPIDLHPNGTSVEKWKSQDEKKE
ncbi:MAG: hypothetical protein OEV93_01455 [Candidatus Moranbacteria bacterium]|nr:hypothetical protein [Candidatus Moranbacteria bacterium]